MFWKYLETNSLSTMGLFVRRMQTPGRWGVPGVDPSLSSPHFCSSVPHPSAWPAHELPGRGQVGDEHRTLVEPPKAREHHHV